MKQELLQPKEVEVEKYTEDDYDDMLNECYPDCEVAGQKFDTAYALKELDPTAYRCGFADYQEYETKWACPICEEEHDEEEDALYCCQEEPDEDDEEELED